MKKQYEVDSNIDLELKELGNKTMMNTKRKESLHNQIMSKVEKKRVSFKPVKVKVYVSVLTSLLILLIISLPTILKHQELELNGYGATEEMNGYEQDDLHKNAQSKDLTEIDTTEETLEDFADIQVTEDMLNNLSIPLDVHEKIDNSLGKPKVFAESRPVGINVRAYYGTEENEIMVSESSNPHKNVAQMTEEAKGWYEGKNTNFKEFTIVGNSAILEETEGNGWNTLHIITEEKFFTLVAIESEILIEIANLIEFD
jgi:hypothetical protein